MSQSASGTDHREVVWLGRRLEGIVFDVDGTLTDSISAYLEAFWKTCKKVDLKVPKDFNIHSMTGNSGFWERVVPADYPGRNEKIIQCQEVGKEMFCNAVVSVQTFPGLMEILSCLRQTGLKLGILTASIRAALLPLENQGLLGYFDAVVSREDGHKLKPAPDGMLACLEMMHVDPVHALSIGDSPMDVRAGKEAGTLTIGVLTGLADRAQLEVESPSLIIGGVGELTTVLGLPRNIAQ